MTNTRKEGFSVGKYIAVGGDGEIAFTSGQALKDLQDDIIKNIMNKKKPTKEDLIVLVVKSQSESINRIEKKLNEPRGFWGWLKRFRRKTQDG